MGEEARAYIQSGEIISNLIDMLLDEVMVIVDDLTTNLSVDTSIAFSGVWKSLSMPKRTTET